MSPSHSPIRVDRTRLAALAAFVLGCGAGLPAPTAAAANLIQNGGFELGPEPDMVMAISAGSNAIQGWTVTGAAIDYVGGQWADNHTLESYEFDAWCGAFDRLERTLQDGTTLSDPLNDWQTDESTIFRCEDHLEDNAYMTFAFAVYDQQGFLADCLAFGHDPEGMRNGIYNIVGDAPVFDLANCVDGEEAQ